MNYKTDKTYLTRNGESVHVLRIGKTIDKYELQITVSGSRDDFYKVSIDRDVTRLEKSIIFDYIDDNFYLKKYNLELNGVRGVKRTAKMVNEWIEKLKDALSKNNDIEQIKILEDRIKYWEEIKNTNF